MAAKKVCHKIFRSIWCKPVIEAGLSLLGVELIPIAFADTVHLLDLPLHHRDPFDRLIIAQAINRFLMLVSADEVFDAYPVQRLWH